MHPLPGLSLSLQSSSLPRLLLLLKFSTPSPSRITSKTEALAVSAGYCCFFVLRSHSPARQRCNDRRIRTSSSPLIPRRIASLVLPACRSSSQDDLFGDGTTTPEHLPACQLGQGCLVKGSGFPDDLLMRR
ncbi:hypothetical protein BGZ57DRAFT_848028 [Hyaloscypha finlandica]|nr:hypothetical protein BGZ57DRAFT_848028 [Hyaloscypha finlandica]